MGLDLIRNVGLGQDQGLPGNLDYALVRAATYGWRQLISSLIGDIRADDGKVTRAKFENVGAAI